MSQRLDRPAQSRTMVRTASTPVLNRTRDILARTGPMRMHARTTGPGSGGLIAGTGPRGRRLQGGATRGYRAPIKTGGSNSRAPKVDVSQLRAQYFDKLLTGHGP